MESPSARSRNSLRKKRERVPIQFIEIETNPDTRDDTECQDEKVSENLLLTLIEKRDWIATIEHLKTPQGIEEANRDTQSNNQRDLPLHLMCQCGKPHPALPKYVGHIRVQKSYSSSKSDSSGSSDSRSFSASQSGSTSEEDNSQSHFPANDNDGERFAAEALHHKNCSITATSDHPNAEVLMAMMNASLKAVRTPGSGGNLPLHFAIRHGYSKELLLLLIQTYPQALDIRDLMMRTPRDYAAVLDISTRVAFSRPTSCWLQESHDLANMDAMEQELVQLEKEVSVLLATLVEAHDEEQQLVAKLEKLEHEIQQFAESRRMNEFSKRSERIQQQLGLDMDILRSKLEGFAGGLAVVYADDEKERAYLASFNQDVERIYREANASIEELRAEMKEIGQRMG